MLQVKLSLYTSVSQVQACQSQIPQQELSLVSLFILKILCISSMTLFRAQFAPSYLVLLNCMHDF